MPIVLVLMAIVFAYLNWVGQTGMKEIPGTDRIIAERKAALGPWRRGEINAVIAFGVTVCLWVGPGLLALVLGNDHPVARSVLAQRARGGGGARRGGAVVPAAHQPDRAHHHHLEAGGPDRLGGPSFCFGGGLALGGLAASTGLARVVAEGITGLVPTSDLVTLTFAAALFTVILSETMSNTAATNIAVPIVISIAAAAGVNPIIPTVAAALSASVADALPVSTPPNAIVYASGRVRITDMIRYGVLMDFIAVTVVPALVLLIAPALHRVTRATPMSEQPRLLRRGAGLERESAGTHVVGSSLDHLIGTWTTEEADAMERAIEEFARIDEAMWRLKILSDSSDYSHLKRGDRRIAELVRGRRRFFTCPRSRSDHCARGGRDGVCSSRA